MASLKGLCSSDSAIGCCWKRGSAEPGLIRRRPSPWPPLPAQAARAVGTQSPAPRGGIRVDETSTDSSSNVNSRVAENTDTAKQLTPSDDLRGLRSLSLSPSFKRSIDDSDEEVSAIMEGVTFAQLCDDFECVSSPAVERTARLLARDIHDIREDKRSLSCFATNVTYSDPLRSFLGRDKYRRQSWILNALEQPRVNMISMEMLSTSQLVIKWRLRGSFRMLPGANLMGGALDVVVTSRFTLNQISGQVTEHRDEWDLSRSPPQGAAFFYSSRLAWSTLQKAKDIQEGVRGAGSLLDKASKQDSSFVYPDPSGDPRKFFVQDDPNRELYQFALAVALLYLLVQFLQQVL